VESIKGVIKKVKFQMLFMKLRKEERASNRGNWRSEYISWHLRKI